MFWSFEICSIDGVIVVCSKFDVYFLTKSKDVRLIIAVGTKFIFGGLPIVLLPIQYSVRKDIYYSLTATRGL